MLFAYLALLNSYEFESLLELLCPKVRGGQYQLYAADMRKVPLPDLWRAPTPLLRDLTALGQRITRGDGLDPDEASTLASKAYGCSERGFRKRFARGEIGELQEVFYRLARQWKRESAHMSKVSSMEQLPSYAAIIALGERAIPLLLRELRHAPDYWFGALSALAKVDPVAKEHRGRIKHMTEEWIRWGVENRQF
jgi:hypothetical protein